VQKPINQKPEVLKSLVRNANLRNNKHRASKMLQKILFIMISMIDSFSIGFQNKKEVQDEKM